MGDETLADALAPVFRSLAECSTPARGERPARLSPEAWRLALEAGLPWIGVAESAGGSGGTVQDALESLRLSGFHATALPLLETSLLGGRAAELAGLEVGDEPVGWAPYGRRELRIERRGAGWVADGELTRVPWGEDLARLGATVRVAGRDHVVVLDVRGARGVDHRPGENVAGEPRTTLVLSGVEIPPERVVEVDAGTADAFQPLGALGRAMQMVGAMQRAVALSLDHTRTRCQFGRPLVRFQAVAQQVAQAAEAVALADMCCGAGSDAVGRGDAWPAAARAKVVAGETARLVARIAHQVHGAIGMTEEYALGRFTTRLWAWEREYGTTAHWAARLGERVVADGSQRLFDELAWPQEVGRRAAETRTGTGR